jgi:hypothetical protein
MFIQKDHFHMLVVNLYGYIWKIKWNEWNKIQVSDFIAREANWLHSEEFSLYQIQSLEEQRIIQIIWVQTTTTAIRWACKWLHVCKNRWELVTHIDKTLVLKNYQLSMSYWKSNFQQKNSRFKGFAGLYPQHCFIARGSGTLSVCVQCTIHQNVMLMVTTAENKITLAEDGVPLKSA